MHTHTKSRLLKQCLVFCLSVLLHLRQRAVCMHDGDWHEKTGDPVRYLFLYPLCTTMTRANIVV
jgi:hypothetical protein